MASSLVAGVYEKTVDRESAYEKLKGRTPLSSRPARRPGNAQNTAATPQEGGGMLGGSTMCCLAPPARAAAGATAWRKPWPSRPCAPWAPRWAARFCAACWAASSAGARVGHIGLYRDPATLQAVQYYFKMPSDMQERDVIVLDPMLATGNSAVAALDRIKALKPRSVKFVCLLTCPEGIATVHKAHPDVPIYTAAIDRELNDHGYILPGLGDAGDRIFGTT
jgi:hypothetical protein